MKVDNQSSMNIFFFSFPFDTKTPMGFLAGALYELAVGQLASELFYAIVGLTGGFCFYTMQFVADLNELLQDLNKDLEIGETAEIQRKFFEIVRFHSEIIELSQFCVSSTLLAVLQRTYSKLFSLALKSRFCNRFGSLNSAAIFTYLLYSIVSFANVLLSFNMVNILRELSFCLKIGCSYL